MHSVFLSLRCNVPTASQKDGANLQPQSHFKLTVIRSVGKWTFSPVFIVASVAGEMTDKVFGFVPLHFCSLSFSFQVPEEPASQWSAHALTTCSSFPEKERRPRIVPIFCLSKISQRLEVVSLLVVAMLFQCLGGKTEHWTMFFRFRSVSDHSIDPICGMVVSSKLLALLAFSFMVFKTPSTDTASSCSFQQS